MLAPWPIVLALVSVLAPPPAAADPPLDPELSELLDEPIASTAGRRQEPISAAPATVFTITAEEIRAHGIRSVAEALEYLGNGIAVQRPYGEVGARGLTIAGDSGAHMLVLVNGHRMNGMWGGEVLLDRSLGVPIEAIEHIEISLGPGSILYGTNAMFGVINVVTRSVDEPAIMVSAGGAVAPPVGAGGGLRPATAGYHVGHDARAALSWTRPFPKLRRGGGVALHVQAFDGSDPTQHYGIQASPYDPGPRSERDGLWWGGVARRRARGLGAMASLHLGRFELDLLAVHHVQRDPFEWDADFADPRNGTSWTKLHADLRHTVDLGTRVRFASRAFADLARWQGDWIYSDAAYWCLDVPTTCRQTELDRDARAGVEEQVTVDWLHDSSLVTLVGATGQWTGVDDSFEIRELSTGRPSGYDLLDSRRGSGAGAVYVEQSWWPTERVALDAGGRFDVDQNFGWHLSPRAALTVLPWRLANLKLLYAEAFRAPGLGELLYEDPLWYLRAGHLRAEVVRSLELTAEQRLPSGRGSARLGGFYGWWTDLIGQGPVTREAFDAGVAAGALDAAADPDYVLQYQNIAKYENFGGFAALQTHTLDRTLQFGLNLGVAQALDRRGSGAPERPLALFPTVQGNARLFWRPVDPIPSLGLAASYQSRRRTIEDVEGAFDQPVVAGHLVQWRFTVDGAIPRTRGLRYSATLEHVATRRGAYLVGPTRSSGGPSQPELIGLPPLTVMFGLRHDFALAPKRGPGRATGASP